MKKMVKEKQIMLLVTYIRVNGKIVKEMVEEYINGQQVKNMMESGEMAREMVQE